MRRRPYSVILFDEIEKAAKEVFNVFLQILDDGRLTDGQGRTVDFRNTIVIMTSNIGSNWIQEEKNYDEIKRRVQEALRAHFPPEFLNRIDEIVIFKRLDDRQLTQIVDIQLDDMRRRLAEKRIRFELTDNAKRVIAKEGFDPAFGARPLKRAIQHLVADPLAKKVIAGEIREGSTVKVDSAKGNDAAGLNFSSK